jgi:proteasome lid subunit RPN8/RPN11
VSSKSKKGERPANVRISSDVVRQIHQHARATSKAEVCGVLIGCDADGVTSIDACIAGVNATQGGAHVTFTQDTWEHIYKIKDRDYPNDRIVGWYHSHPGFGVFLSDHDTFIHKNFCSSPQQVAWVYDPHSDEEGCFGWAGERIERLANFSIFDGKGGEGAGETGKPEPSVFDVENVGESKRDTIADAADPDDPWPLVRMLVAVASYVAIFLLGALLFWYLFPPKVYVVPVDTRTGMVGMPQQVTGAMLQQILSADQEAVKKAADQAAQKNSGNAKGSDAQRQ